MNKANFVWAAVGVAIGSVATWFFVKRYYGRISQEEIDSVKTVYATRNKAAEEDQQKADAAKDKPDIGIFGIKPNENAAADMERVAGLYKTKDENDILKNDKPYIIPPDAFGENEEYERISLTYYAGDETLADDMDDIIEFPERVIVPGFEDHFGEYEDDSVFLCNDATQCYYEILKDNRAYADVINERHY